MIRRILEFTLVLLFMWACMIAGLWLISEVIVPFQLPGIYDYLVTGTLKVAISAGLAIFWLWLWREIIRRMFWRTMRSQMHRATEEMDKEPTGRIRKEGPREEGCDGD
jgi:hypothetical protein